MIDAARAMERAANACCVLTQHAMAYNGMTAPPRNMLATWRPAQIDRERASAFEIVEVGATDAIELSQEV
jgi:hypothetical protein